MTVTPAQPPALAPVRERPELAPADIALRDASKASQFYDRVQTTMVRYDPQELADEYHNKFFKLFGRLWTILTTFLGFALGLWLDKVGDAVEKNEAKRAVQLKDLLTKLGPAYIKIGQALSTRPDLVPPTYLEELSKLQDQIPPFPNAQAFQFIREELGADPSEIYAEISDSPIAAASLGQVYKGRLKTGEAVAVKVQRPDLGDRVCLDLYLVRNLALFAQQNIGRIRSDLVAIVDEFATRIFEEMDYAHEAYNAERFATLYGKLPDIYIPKIYGAYTGRRVLTMEWIDGIKLTDLEAVAAKGINPTELIEVGVQCSLRQLLEYGFFHADPHPGNLLAMDNGKLAYLDFGMMSEVKTYQRYGLIEAVVHLVNRDFERLAEDYVKLEFLTPETNLAPIIPALSGVFSNALGASVAELNFKSMTDRLSELMYEYPFQVPAYYALIIRSLVTLEGIAINVDPDFKVLSKAYPYVAKRLLTDPAPELRTSLKERLFKDGSFRWNRLENLLKNARDSQDYDLGGSIEKAIDFLFSERGEFIRTRIVDEVVRNIDVLSQDAVRNTNQALSDWLGLPKPESQQPASQQVVTVTSEADRKNLEHIRAIWGLLQETPGFDPMKILRVVPTLLSKPETQQMGQEIISNLMQRAAARLIREVLIDRGEADSAPVAAMR